jgi:hypothetical protein
LSIINTYSKTELMAFKNHWQVLGFISFTAFLSLNVLWLLLNKEDRSSDESVFLYFSIIASNKIEFGLLSMLGTYFNTISFRPPLISLQAIPWLYIGINPPLAALLSQFVWLLVIYLACKSYLKDRCSPLLVSTWIFLTPYFTSQIREFHTDLGCAALTLATYISFFSLKNSHSLKEKNAATACFSISIGFGMLMRPDFIINIAPIFLMIPPLLLEKNFGALKRFTFACIFSLVISLPWYVKNWHSFTTWFKGNGISGSLSISEILMTRLEILGFFALGCLVSISPLLYCYLKGIKERQKPYYKLGDFLALSGILIILIHLLIDISLPTRTRMLLSAACLIVVGVSSARNYTTKTILLTTLISLGLTTYLSFFYTPMGGARSIGIINAIPHKSTYKSQHNKVLTECKKNAMVLASNASMLVQPYGVFTYESFLLASTNDYGVLISTDIFTTPSTPFDYTIYDCFLSPVSPNYNQNRIYQYTEFIKYLQKNPSVKLNKVFIDGEGNKVGLYIRQDHILGH